MSLDFVELRYHGSSGTVLLPDFKAIAFDKKYNDLGVIEFSYPLEKAKSLGLQDQREVSVSVGFSDGTSLDIERYLIESTNEELASDGQRYMLLSGRSTLVYLEDAVVYPSNWDPVTKSGAAPSGHRFVDMTLGTIFRTLILRAKNRGALLNISETSFSGTSDSRGSAWAEVHTRDFANGTTYLSILQGFMEMGYADVQMDGNALRIYNGGTLGNHISQGVVEVRPAYNTSEMTTQTDSSESASIVFVEGDEGTVAEAYSAQAQSLLGRRRERFTSHSGIPDVGVLSILANAEIGIYGKIPREETVGISAHSDLTPFLDFAPGDWVWVRYNTEENAQEQRVRQLAVSVDETRAVTVGMTIGDIIDEQEIRLLRKMEGYLGSGGSYPNDPDEPDDDTIAPGPPTGVNIMSDAYEEIDGTTKSAMVVTWLAPQFNVDGTIYDDPGGYEVQWRYSAKPPEVQIEKWPASMAEWGPLYPSDDEVFHYSPLIPKAKIELRVRAVDDDGNVGPWSASVIHTLQHDNIPPQQPSRPIATARLGTVRIEWDGLDSAGQPMPIDFGHAAIHMGTTPDFAPTAENKIGFFGGADVHAVPGLPYGSQVYFRLVAYDRTGNGSTPSEASEMVEVKPLVDTDFIEMEIDGANIIDGTITASEKIVGQSIIGANIKGLEIEGGHIKGNTITADKIEAGSVSAMLVRGEVFETVPFSTGDPNYFKKGIKLSTAGLKAYNGSSSNAVFDLDANTGNVKMVGSLTTGSTITGALITGSTIRTAETNPSTGQPYYPYWEFGSNSAREYIGCFLSQSIRTAGGMNLSYSSSYLGSGYEGSQLEIAPANWDTNYTNRPSLRLVAMRSGGTRRGAVEVRNGNFYLMGASQIVYQSRSNMTTGHAPIVGINASGFLTNTGLNSSSSLRFKKDIETIESVDTDAVLALRPVRFHYKDYPESAPRSIGYIAEEAEELGFGDWVFYDGEGRPEGFNYFAWPIAQQFVLRKHDQVIKELIDRIAQLEGTA